MAKYNEYELRFLEILVSEKRFLEILSEIVDNTFNYTIIENLKLPLTDGEEWLKGLIQP